MGKKKFRSFLADRLEEFVLSKYASGVWTRQPDNNLYNFDSFLAKEYPYDKVLTDKMLEWCKRRQTERESTCSKRTHAIWDFVEYSNRQGWSDLKIDRVVKWEPCTYVPHYFTKEELSLFFRECDSYAIYLREHQGTKDCQLISLEMPVYFRLLFSSGLRTCEARWLKRGEIDFSTGVVEIKKSKGGHQHRIVLHPTMLELLRKYDETMEKIMPGRIHLFPNKKDMPHRDYPPARFFNKVWEKVSSERARPYDFRSNYAVTNISKWDNHGYEFSGKLMFLSRSMGHVNIGSTYHYFHVTPMLNDKLRARTSDNFSKLAPSVQESKVYRDEE